MKITAYNPQKGRLETLDVEYTTENTTWFTDTGNPRDISMITDYQGGILLQNCGYHYPTWLYDLSRAEIGFSRTEAKKLVKRINY
jgi:hypothetical protein